MYPIVQRHTLKRGAMVSRSMAWVVIFTPSVAAIENRALTPIILRCFDLALDGRT